MTILIKGMEMPKEGTVLVIDSSGEVWSNTWPTRGYTRVDKAKAVEVPTPHGRLGDLNKLINHIDDKYWDSIWIKSTALSMIEQEIRHAPTVIEAEEG